MDAHAVDRLRGRHGADGTAAVEPPVLPREDPCSCCPHSLRLQCLLRACGRAACLSSVALSKIAERGPTNALVLMLMSSGAVDKHTPQRQPHP